MRRPCLWQPRLRRTISPQNPVEPRRRQAIALIFRLRFRNKFRVGALSQAGRCIRAGKLLELSARVQLRTGKIHLTSV